LILRTTPDLLKLPAREFFDEVIRQRLDARAIVEGTNFGFGRKREGTIETLEAFCKEAGLTLSVVPPFTTENGRAVSSSRVRAAIVAGDLREAAKLLGRLYFTRGVVGTGQRRGQTLGFPTANLDGVATLLPKDGVYAGVALNHAAAINIGPNPTFGEHARKVEVHLIGFQGDLYGQELSVNFLERLRDTRPFDSREALVNQLHADIDAAKRIFQGHGK
jgi:riboflavin kinase/FMN adenylyltransferase